MNPLQQITDALGQAAQQAPGIAQQLSAIAAPFAHGLPAAPPPPPPLTPPTGSTGQAVLVGLGAVAVIGLGAWLLGGRAAPHFGAVTLADLSETERIALHHLQDPNYDFPDEAIWYDAIDRLRSKGLMTIVSDPNRHDYEMYALTYLGQHVLDPHTPVPDTLRSPTQEDPASATRLRPRYSLDWKESA